MIRKKLGLHKIKESKESRNERYNCHRHLKKNSLVKIDSRNKKHNSNGKEYRRRHEICQYPYK